MDMNHFDTKGGLWIWLLHAYGGSWKMNEWMGWIGMETYLGVTRVGDYVG